MSDVLEQGPTRWARPGDYGGPVKPGKRNPNPPPGRYRPNPKAPKRPVAPRPGEPGYKPRLPRRVPEVRPRFDPIFERMPDPYKLKRIPLRRFAPAVPLFFLAFDLVDYIPGLKLPLDVPYPNPGNGWRYQSHCPHAPERDIIGSAGTTWGTGEDCLSGQALSVNSPPISPPDHWNKYAIWERYTTQANWAYVRGWVRDSIDVNNEPKLITHTVGPARPMPPPGQNPNVLRLLPTLPPNWMPGDAVPIPSPQPEPVTAPDLQPAPPGFPWTTIRVDDPNGPPKRGGRPVRKPPRRRDKERKVIGSRAIALRIFKALDAVSESAEVVDSFYMALPKKVRKYEEGRRDCFKPRGLIDSAGQYGIDNADCKLQVLYRRWELVDMDVAFENLLKNQLEDKLYGFVYREISKHRGWHRGIRQPI